MLWSLVLKASFCCCAPLYYWGQNKSKSRDAREPAAATWARFAGGEALARESRGGEGAGFQVSFACMVRKVSVLAECRVLEERSIRDCPKVLGFSNCEKGYGYSWENTG